MTGGQFDSEMIILGLGYSFHMTMYFPVTNGASRFQSFSVFIGFCTRHTMDDDMIMETFLVFLRLWFGAV